MSKANQQTHAQDGGILYVVATPIGNLRDITLRALDTLRSVDRIFCEDTRRTRTLLSHYAITHAKPPESLHAYSEVRKSARVITLLAAGTSVAYVTDAGTPAISDPGARLVDAVRHAGFRVVPIPGASAVSALLSVGGLTGAATHIEGFLPRRAGRRTTRLRRLLAHDCAVALFESPRRIVALLHELQTIVPDATVVVGRELTKQYEEILSGSPAQLAQQLGERQAVMGEISLLIAVRRRARRSPHMSRAGFEPADLRLKRALLYQLS